MAEIKKYIEKYSRRGYDVDGLKKFLIKKGYPKKDVVEAVKETHKRSEMSKGMLNKVSPHNLMIGILALIILIAIIWLVVYGITGERDCGFDKDCFILKANECSSAVVKENYVGSVIEYSVGKDCVLVKKLVKFAEDEPEEVRMHFQGKVMTCPYEKGNFNEDFVDSLIGGIEECSGSLKDAIYQLRIAQYLSG